MISSGWHFKGNNVISEYFLGLLFEDYAELGNNPAIMMFIWCHIQLYSSLTNCITSDSFYDHHQQWSKGKNGMDHRRGRACSYFRSQTKLAMHIQDKINLSSINAKIIITYDRFTGSETTWRQYKFRYL